MAISVDYIVSERYVDDDREKPERDIVYELGLMCCSITALNLFNAVQICWFSMGGGTFAW